MVTLSADTQRIMMWWGVAFAMVFGYAWYFLLHMIPLPDARLNPMQVVEFYSHYAGQIRLGATVASWTSGYMLPFTVVLSLQMMRLEKGFPIWATLQLVGGALVTIFLVLPPMLWGVAAYDVARIPDVTAMMNQFANLSLITADQYYMFQNIPIIVVALMSVQRPDSPFPRWYGYISILATIIIEVGPVAFVFHSGPFAWSGLFSFWLPLVAYSSWFTLTNVMVLRALARQGRAEVTA